MKDDYEKIKEENTKLKNDMEQMSQPPRDEDYDRLYEGYNKLKNDFNFPEEESNIGKRHFEIKYDLENDEYKIKNLSGSGLYIK